jgi:exopolysaccharide production protein ExoZ
VPTFPLIEHHVHNKKLHSVQAARGVAVLLVLAFHLREVQHHYLGTPVGSLSAFGNAGVDLFFVISGFVVVGLARKLENTGIRGFFEFTYDRIARIYPIYWIYSLVLLVPFIFRPSLVNSLARMHGTENYVRSFLLLPDTTSPILLVGWTLVFEVYFYALLALALFARLPLRVALILWSAAIVICNITGNEFDATQHPFFALARSPLSLEFIFGACISYALLRPLGKALGALLLLASLALVAILCGTTNLPRENIDPWFRTLCYGPIAVIFLVGAISLETFFCARWLVWLVVIGDASYSIYLSHTLVLSGAGRLLGAMTASDWSKAALVASVAGLCPILGYWSYRYLEIPLQGRFKTGKRIVLGKLFNMRKPVLDGEVHSEPQQK